MRHRRAAQLGDALDLVPGRHEIDGDGIRVAGDRQRGSLARLGNERLEMGARHRAQVDAEQHEVAEVDEPDPESVQPRAGSRSA